MASRPRERQFRIPISLFNATIHGLVEGSGTWPYHSCDAPCQPRSADSWFLWCGGFNGIRLRKYFVGDAPALAIRPLPLCRRHRTRRRRRNGQSRSRWSCDGMVPDWGKPKPDTRLPSSRRSLAVRSPVRCVINADHSLISSSDSPSHLWQPQGHSVASRTGTDGNRTTLARSLALRSAVGRGQTASDHRRPAESPCGMEGRSRQVSTTRPKSLGTGIFIPNIANYLEIITLCARPTGDGRKELLQCWELCVRTCHGPHPHPS
jgi:hypothetical protein